MPRCEKESRLCEEARGEGCNAIIGTGVIWLVDRSWNITILALLGTVVLPNMRNVIAESFGNNDTIFIFTLRSLRNAAGLFVEVSTEVWFNLADFYGHTRRKTSLLFRAVALL